MASAMVKQIERQEGSQVFQGLALGPVLGGFGAQGLTVQAFGWARGVAQQRSRESMTRNVEQWTLGQCRHCYFKGALLGFGSSWIPLGDSSRTSSQLLRFVSGGCGFLASASESSES